MKCGGGVRCCQAAGGAMLDLLTRLVLDVADVMLPIDSGRLKCKRSARAFNIWGVCASQALD